MSNTLRPVRAIWPGATKANPHGTPGPARIAFVGEAPGADEQWLGRPFVGASGIELDTWLRQVGIDRSECLFTNVVDTQPEENNFAKHCMRKEDLPDGYPILHMGPAYTEGGNYYLRPELLHNGPRLRAELELARPNVVVALGGVACWYLLHNNGVGALRGVVHRSRTSTPYKVLPTWHPAAVMRNWRMRPVAVVDLAKALAQSAFPEIHYDNAEIWLEPTLSDLVDFERRYIPPGALVSVDIETMRGEIHCIGFAPDRERAIVVPFRTHPVYFKKSATIRNGHWAMTRNYWPTLADERTAWRWVKRQCERLDTHKLGQNHMYDIQYEQLYGINIMNLTEDTMLAQHSRYSEMPKDLGFLGSIHANFPNWKTFGSRHSTEDKRDA